MADISVRTYEGGYERLGEAFLEQLRGQLRGELLLPGDGGYDGARSIWNAMIDRRPALIIRCAGAADVMCGVEVAREHGLLLSVKGGGHNIAGRAVCEGGLMLDLSQQAEVHVDPERRRAWVSPGATLRDVDHETQVFGLATPLGINSTTGVAGLTLGGGFGWLSRKYGLTIDNLRGAHVVTARSELVHASEDEHPDLFWALRGGGGSVGVVTSFELELHPVGPQVLSGLRVYPLREAADVLQRYSEQLAAMPDELACWVVVRRAPPLPFVPVELHGREAIFVAIMYAGDIERAAGPVDHVRAALGPPAGEHVIPHPYTAWQQTFDPLLAPGARNYWKSHNLTQLSDGAIACVLDFGGRLPSDQSEIFIGQLGGAASRPAPDATAYPHRDAQLVMNVHTRWTDPADDARAIRWAREFHTAMTPFATGGVYSNFVSEGDDVAQAEFGDNYARLLEVKARWDPENLFRTGAAARAT